MNIQLHQLVEAYRKAKVDAFYENGHVNAEQFAHYEANLIENLKSLQSKLLEKQSNWFKSAEFVGTAQPILKSIKLSSSEKDSGVYYSCSKNRWDDLTNKIKKVEFRVIGRHPVEFHIIASLWLELVGYNLDKKLSKSSYGCRLIQGKEDQESRANRYGHFQPYFHAYKAWQENGISAIENAVKSSKKVVAITADITKFYHCIDCNFLLKEDFYEKICCPFPEGDNLELTSLLVNAIKAWSKFTLDNGQLEGYLNKEFDQRNFGIPIGLSASKLIANLVLWELDQSIQAELSPIYYGRYVDDIFLVIEDHGKFESPQEIWGKYILNRIIKNNELNISISYSPKTRIIFGEDKRKVFFLENFCGSTFLEAVRNSLNENSSLWDLPPNLTEDLELFVNEVARASSDLTESTNSLRKAEGLSLQRLKFVLYLKRIEVLTDFVPEAVWKEKLPKFFQLVLHHGMTPDNFAIYLKYYPRIIQLAAKTKSFDFIKEIITKIITSFEALESVSPEQSYFVTSSKEYVRELLAESLAKGLHPFKTDYRDLPVFSELSDLLHAYSSDLEDLKTKLFLADLHSIPYKAAFFEEGQLRRVVYNSHNFVNLDDLNGGGSIVSSYVDFCNLLFSDKRDEFEKMLDLKHVPLALYFFTRPFNLSELGLLFPNWHHEENANQFKHFFRLFKIDIDKSINSEQFNVTGCNEGQYKIEISNQSNLHNPRFVFTSLETKDKSWEAVVMGWPEEPDESRIQRIFDLCSSILQVKNISLDYVVFPELSIPRKLLLYLSKLFLSRNISLIIGAEYQVDSVLHSSGIPHVKKFVSNQLIYFLTVKGQFRNNHACIVQEKVIPAIHEEKDLFSVGGAILRAKDEKKYLINHNGFWFAGLICNEFMDIQLRAFYRGKVDALIAVEWNKDTETYNALVESTANDLHSFIIQVNNRRFGDTRLRAPYKENYQRDIVRVRGGELDYFVVAPLDVESLRQFQRHHRSPEKPFKPTPTGFEMSSERRFNL